MIFTLNGIEFPMVMSDVEYSRADLDLGYGMDLHVLRMPSEPFTFETSIPISGFESFAALLRNDPPGASATTLARRVRYGGRKGRSAMRRLFARAVPTELATSDGMRFRGRMVMVNETEMRMRMSQRSGRGKR